MRVGGGMASILMSSTCAGNQPSCRRQSAAKFAKFGQQHATHAATTTTATECNASLSKRSKQHVGGRAWRAVPSPADGPGWAFDGCMQRGLGKKQAELRCGMARMNGEPIRQDTDAWSVHTAGRQHSMQGACLVLRTATACCLLS
eukprot:355965-Chlamydomonas_euryale.AAC.1